MTKAAGAAATTGAGAAATRGARTLGLASGLGAAVTKEMAAKATRI